MAPGAGMPFADPRRVQFEVAAARSPTSTREKHPTARSPGRTEAYQTVLDGSAGIKQVLLPTGGRA